MNMQKQYTGEWFLPDKLESKLHGTLYLKEDNKMELHFYGIIDGTERLEYLNQHFIRGYEIILGIADGELISLIACNGIDTTVRPSTGEILNRYSVGAALIGCHFNNIANIKFSNFTFRVSLLNRWLRRTGFSVEIENENDFTMRYRQALPVSLQLIDNTKISFSLGKPFPPYPLYKETLEIFQNAYIEMEYEEEKDLETIITSIKIFQQFISLSFNQAVHINNVYVYATERMTNGKRNNSIPEISFLFYRNASVTKVESENEMIFSYEDIKDELNIAIQKYFHNADSLHGTFRNYFISQFNQYLSSDVRFTNFAHALESFHRCVHGGEYEPKEEYLHGTYSNLVSAIPLHISMDYRKSLISKMEYHNEFSLRSRLKDLMRNYQSVLPERLFSNKKDCVSFISKTVEYRNRLTHIDQNPLEHEDWIEINKLSKKMRVILLVCILHYIGYSEETIKKIHQKRNLNR